jgi:ribosomal protein S18 acetylase RimI-like enzyme
VSPTLRVDALTGAHRGRVEQILRNTAVFGEDEVAVALELFDETFSHERTANGDQRSEHDADRQSPVAGRYLFSPAPASSDYAFLGAFTPEDELIGYACYGPTPGTDRTYDLYWIAVDPSAQGTGSGTILLREVERRLRGQHARLLVVETSSRSEYTATRAFYERRGYAEVARVGHFYAPGDDRIIFTKRFQAAPSGLGVASP